MHERNAPPALTYEACGVSSRERRPTQIVALMMSGMPITKQGRQSDKGSFSISLRDLLNNMLSLHQIVRSFRRLWHRASNSTASDGVPSSVGEQLVTKKGGACMGSCVSKPSLSPRSVGRTCLRWSIALQLLQFASAGASCPTAVRALVLLVCNPPASLMMSRSQ